ncbi:MAG: hypothetical protein ACJ8AT_07375 [Hyalangium sp.]|uniref:hypothetical protein n=1 Tax=Hyalangium sp. TaxID=2028555 RepID=UPI00389A7B32
MTNKFSRFLNLERARGAPPKSEEQPQLQSGNRFETLAQRGAAPQQAAVPETHLERFRGEAPLALAEEPSSEEEELRFPRCGSCESDNGRFSKECTVCGADLTTPQQRAYNERLWQARQQERAREREAAAALSQQKHAQERQADQARYSVLMQKLKREERSNGMGGLFFGEGSFGWKLLGLVPSMGVRIIILSLAVIVPVALVKYGRGQARSAGMIAGFIVLMLFLPGRSKRWWR